MKNPFQTAKHVENGYYRRLRQVCRQIDSIVKGFAPNGIVSDLTALRQTMEKYAELIKPWARVVATRMIEEVQAKDHRAWTALSGTMKRNLQKEVATAPTGNLLRELLAEQVKLITSLPIEAAQRVHELMLEGLAEGTRAKEVQEEIMRSGEVSEGRAKCIARTEVARASSSLVEARAKHAGSEHFIWRTAGDSDVRLSHKEVNGKMFKWAEPPLLSDGYVTLPGQIFNCRCYPEPVFVDDED